MEQVLVTTVSSAGREVQISRDRPTVLIGERINPTGRKRLAEALRAGELSLVAQEVRAQVEAGADIVDINVGAAGVDEVRILPLAVQTALEAADVPLSLDTTNPAALKAALEVYPGKALVNSVNGEEGTLERVLPLVREHRAAVIGLTMDGEGIPAEPLKRLKIAERIVERAEREGIPRQDVLIDCLALTVGANPQAAQVTLEAIRLVARELGVNQTLGVSNVSFGLPDREVINLAFLALALMNGVNCPIVDVAKVRPTVLAVDLLLGRDRYARRYIEAWRRRTRPGPA
jgi:5-methyltetrahydrofolate--homocysteine methyltransferase